LGLSSGAGDPDDIATFYSSEYILVRGIKKLRSLYVLPFGLFGHDLAHALQIECAMYSSLKVWGADTPFPFNCEA